MRSRRVVAALGVMLLVVAGTLYASPEIIRRVAEARLQAITHRETRIDAVRFDLLKGRVTVHGLRVAERDGAGPFADFELVDIRVRPLSLLRGHLWIREATIQGSTVRVVRSGDRFNFSDLIERTGGQAGGYDVTLDRFTLSGGVVTLEDRTLAEPATWTSSNIRIEAWNLSTRRDDGRAIATSVTAGAPVSVKIEQLRLHPIHLSASVTATGLDLGLSRAYLPPDGPVIESGRVTTSARLVLDARSGLRGAMTADLQDVAVVRRGAPEPLLLVPGMSVQLTDLAIVDRGLEVGRLEVSGRASVLDARAGGAGRFKLSTVQIGLSDVTWPIVRPGQLDARLSVSRGGALSLTGSLEPPPARSRLRLRVANLALAPWAQLVPVRARVDGFAEADLRIDEPLAAGVPARVDGSVAVNAVGVSDARGRVIDVRRIEANGIEVHWPRRIAIRQVAVSAPRVLVERDASGDFPLRALLGGAAPGPPAPSTEPATTRESPAFGVTVGTIVVRGGTVNWRDASRAARLDIARLDAEVKGAAWPRPGPVTVRAGLEPPGGGAIEVSGRVAVDPPSAELRVRAANAALAPYQPYVPGAARITGWTDAELSVFVPPSPEPARVRGDAVLARLEVRDGRRTVASAARAAAKGIDASWPGQVTVTEMALEQPWVLVERDRSGALGLTALLPKGPTRGTGNTDPRSSDPLDVGVRQLAVRDGGARIVDRSPDPPVAIDLQRLTVRADGLSTVSPRPAKIAVSGRAGPGTDLELSGTIGPLAKPLDLDLTGELRGFWVPRADGYLLNYVGWQAREGWLTTGVRCRIDRQALDARADIRLSRLQLVKAYADQARGRIGLPLGLILSLMKDSRGDIRVSIPVSGHLSDPRFDFSEAIWSTVRNVALRALTLPVSWIGHVEVGRDARVERIRVEPVRFEPGASRATAQGRAQLERVVSFLEQVPDARLALTAAVSPADLVRLRWQALEADIDSLARNASLSADAAAARLFAARFPGRAAPDSPAAVREALVQNQPVSRDAVALLAAERIEVVRTAAGKAGIDGDRVARSKIAGPVEGAEAQVLLDLADPETVDDQNRGRTTSRAVSPARYDAGSLAGRRG